ncbi:hypothetical protein CLI64_29770 (plasmid) [Nostoc sp. CENA543]|uniref:hypothetical protein n=1 Tax=Nostoc sp. CENA543 TaxID=1869241 RepID=UPI000CA24C55|nr:hypothetical protein [Nostoc sp. CENA543]AUT04628.1 hypothetical protein CLI64_29770 [Nostoc sp. CENA543]
MIESSDAEKIQNDYLDILEKSIKFIYDKAKERGAKPSNQISITVDNKNVYRGVIKDEKFQGISPFVDRDLVDKLNKAIFNPQSLKGKVSIKIGREEVFCVKDGVVVKDKLGLSQSLSQSQNSESQNNVSVSSERTYSLEELQKQIDVLQKKVQEQQKLVDSLKDPQSQTEESIAKLTQQVNELFKFLEKQQKLIENTQQALVRANRSLPPIQNAKLQNFVGAVENQAKQIAQNLYKSVKDAVMPKYNQVKNEIVGMKAQVEKRVNDFKSRIIERSVNTLLKWLGTKQPDGSFSFKSDNFDFQQIEGQVIVRAKNGDVILENGTLSPNTSEQQIKTLENVKEVVDENTKSIEQSVKILLKSFGTKNDRDGSLSFKSENFYFQQTDEDVVILDNNGSVVLEKGVLSPNVSEQQMEAMDKLQQSMSEYENLEQQELELKKQESELLSRSLRA